MFNIKKIKIGSYLIYLYCVVIFFTRNTYFEIRCNQWKIKINLHDVPILISFFRNVSNYSSIFIDITSMLYKLQR